MNDRVFSPYRPLIEKGLELTSEFPMPKVAFFTRTDPVFAGLHTYADIDDGRSYRNVAHYCFSHNLFTRPKPQQIPTIVLPNADTSLRTVVHELGHALDDSLQGTIDVDPCTEYAKVDRSEAFAEAFTCYVLPEYRYLLTKEHIQTMESIKCER